MEMVSSQSLKTIRPSYTYPFTVTTADHFSQIPKMQTTTKLELAEERGSL